LNIIQLTFRLAYIFFGGLLGDGNLAANPDIWIWLGSLRSSHSFSCRRSLVSINQTW